MTYVNEESDQRAARQEIFSNSSVTCAADQAEGNATIFPRAALSPQLRHDG
jgi:hypothetical protein